jgi:CotS family spore coat protein
VVFLTVLNQEPLEAILSHYTFKVLEIRNESYKDKKGVWWIRTPDSLFILKKISNSEDTLKYIISAVRHLMGNGVSLPDIIKTSEGADYVNLDGTCYVLFQAMEGRNPSYGSPSELMKVVVGLAQFHKASAGFFPMADTKPKYHLGLWVEDYQEQTDTMEQFYKQEVITENSNPIAQVVVREFPGFQARAREAIEGLNGSAYRQWVDKAVRAGALCHQDFAAGNLLLGASGTLHVLDTDSITVDIPARDIRKLLNKVMKKAGTWDLELTKKMLAYYQTENPLTPSEWSVVKLDLMFPHLFIGAMSKYYYKRDKEWSEVKYLERIKEMAAFEKTIDPVLQQFDSIIPEYTQRKE